MTDDMKLIIREFFKFIFFGMYIAGAVVFVVLITSIDIHTLGYIPENSLTERTQEALLAISILIFLYRVRKEGRKQWPVLSYRTFVVYAN